MRTMRIEHVALQVPAPVEMAAWYVQHLGLTVVRENADPPCRFLSDRLGGGFGGGSMIELYRNDAVGVPNYAAVDPLHLHLAFVSDAIDADVERLVAAGATPIKRHDDANGDAIAMLRDPWDVPLQLVQRAGVGAG